MKSERSVLCCPWTAFADYLWVTDHQCLVPGLYGLINVPHKLQQLEWQRTQRTDTYPQSNQMHTMTVQVDWQDTLQEHQGAQTKSGIQEDKVKFPTKYMYRLDISCKTHTRTTEVHAGTELIQVPTANGCCYSLPSPHRWGAIHLQFSYNICFVDFEEALSSASFFI